MPWKIPGNVGFGGGGGLKPLVGGSSPPPSTRWLYGGAYNRGVTDHVNDLNERQGELDCYAVRRVVDWANSAVVVALDLRQKTLFVWNAAKDADGIRSGRSRGRRGDVFPAGQRRHGDRCEYHRASRRRCHCRRCQSRFSETNWPSDRLVVCSYWPRPFSLYAASGAAHCSAASHNQLLNPLRAALHRGGNLSNTPCVSKNRTVTINIT